MVNIKTIEERKKKERKLPLHQESDEENDQENKNFFRLEISINFTYNSFCH